MKGHDDTVTAGDRRPEARIFIVEDHPIFRLGMTELINDEPDLAVCGNADTVNRAPFRLSNELHPT